MSEAGGSATLVVVSGDEDGLRLDRWFRRHHPDVSHGCLERWLRSGQVRVDGHRVKAGVRLSPGQVVRVPPQRAEPVPEEAPRAAMARSDVLALQARILHMDPEILVLDKPHGLAVQGGSGTWRHLDGMLDALRFGGERPRLVHRLDRDTSGVLVLARTQAAAAWLGEAFRGKAIAKLYWAIVVGAPPRPAGWIDVPLAKVAASGGERVQGVDGTGQRALTHFRVADRAGRKASWLELEPLTGRTHQLRVHCAALGTPILGDGKYGGRQAFLVESRASRQLHLHARAIRLVRPDGSGLAVAAALPAHIRDTFAFLGFVEEAPDRTLARWQPAARRGPPERPGGAQVEERGKPPPNLRG